MGQPDRKLFQIETHKKEHLEYVATKDAGSALKLVPRELYMTYI